MVHYFYNVTRKGMANSEVQRATQTQ